MDQRSEIIRSILVGTTVMLLISVIVISFVTVYRRRYHQQQNRISLLALENKKNLLAAIINAQEEERFRIAKNIHDDIGVKLSMFKFNLSAAIQDPELSPVVRENITKQLSYFEQTIDDISDTCLDLYPVSLKRLGLVTTLKAHLERVALNSNIHCHDNIVVLPAELNLEPDQQLNLLRIFQEILNNILKYANCNDLMVNVSCADSHIQMAFIHNGIAFSNTDAAGKMSIGIGLESIANRVMMANGNITYEPIASGSKVFVTLPLNP